jgi:hypothetical protein
MQFEWRITGVKVKPLEDGHENVVHIVSFACIGKDGPWREDYCSETNLTYNPEGPFVPYEQLTQEEMLNWVFANITKADYERELQEHHARWLEKQSETPPLPWAVR